VTSTFLVILFSPLFYVLIEKTFGKKKAVEPVPVANPIIPGEQG